MSGARSKTGPEQFFGDEMGEIAAITEASLQRKLKPSQ